MTMKVTRWSPDTCECVIDYQWDQDVPQEERVHTPYAIVKQCQYHKALSLQAHYDVLQDENPRKNKMIGHLMEQHGLKLEEIKWNYDAQRVLHVFVSQLAAKRRYSVQAHADTSFGVGKVIVH
jgi:hypothetical protein